MKVKQLSSLYRVLFRHFGQQHWWPADSSFEVIVGAILTQNTNWKNVSQAISNLKDAGAMTPEGLNGLKINTLAGLIRPSGYYRLKARRMKNFLLFLHNRYGDSVEQMGKAPLALLRQELLSINGIGPETADSILLYAFNKPVFVVDAYTRRIFIRHHLIPANASYGQIQQYCMEHLPRNVAIFNEFHALIVRLGKGYCHKTKPNCKSCPLKDEK